MSDCLEKNVEKFFIRQIMHIHGLTFKLLPFFFRGLPDRVVLHKGRVYFIELKRGKTGKLSKAQTAVKFLFKKHDIFIHYICSNEDTIRFVEYISSMNEGA